MSEETTETTEMKTKKTFDAPDKPEKKVTVKETVHESNPKENQD